MIKHVTEKLRAHVDKAKEVTSEYQQRAKDLLKTCQLVNIPSECLPDVNKIMLVSDDLLYQYENCMDYARVHMRECKEDICKRNCEKVIYACQEAIKSLGSVEMECDTSLNSCISAVQTAIDKTKQCVDELDNFVKNELD